MRLAVQLYTLRGVLDDELEPTLSALAGLGAADVELAGLHGHSPQEWRRALDAAGLRACARHVPLDQLEGNAETAIEAVRALGAETVVVPSVPAPASAREADATVARIAAAARAVAGAGL